MEKYTDLEINILSCILQKPELMEQTNTFPISILHISIDLMTHKGIINYVIHWMMCNDLKVSDKTIITCRQNN